MRKSIHVFLLFLPALTGQDRPRPAVPLDPIRAVLDAFRSHPIVALGEGSHGNEQAHAFRVALVLDPRFAATVNDIVVEFGSAQYQDAMDRFVRGDDVPYGELRRVWQDTTQPDTIWDVPIYEEFFRAVRTVNGSLPRERQLRVLLGDPPMDWSTGVRQMPDRDGHAVDVIRREVLAKDRRALVIYGDQHLIRQNTVAGAPDAWARGIVGQLEREGTTKVFSIHTETRLDLAGLQPDAAGWAKPSLALIRGTVLGAADFPAGPGRRVRNEDQFDAFLYLGPPNRITISQLPRALCSDRQYMEMRLSRMATLRPPADAPFTPVDRLKEYCALPAGDAEIPDREPKMTELIRETLRDAAAGKVDPDRIAPQSRERLALFLTRRGPMFLGPMGELQSLILLAEGEVDGKRVRRYRAVFAGGQKMIWIVGISPEGTIVSLDPRDKI
jgi:hypothetical protein